MNKPTNNHNKNSNSGDKGIVRREQLGTALADQYAARLARRGQSTNPNNLFSFGIPRIPFEDTPLLPCDPKLVSQNNHN